LTGFRFPCAHFPSTTASGYELYLLLWEAVNMLSSFGFKVQYISMDGVYYCEFF
jgi:cytochrome c oxidase subunit IV